MTGELSLVSLRDVLGNRGIRKSLIDLYKEIWKEPPWDENFWTDELVNEDIKFALSQKDFSGKAALQTDGGLYVVGFTWGYQLPKGQFPFLIPFFDEEETFYIDELGVAKPFRGRGTGSKISQLLEEDVDKFGYPSMTLRTDVGGVAYPFYMNRDYVDIGVRDPKYPQRAYMVKRLK